MLPRGPWLLFVIHIKTLDVIHVAVRRENREKWYWNTKALTRQHIIPKAEVQAVKPIRIPSRVEPDCTIYAEKLGSEFLGWCYLKIKISGCLRQPEPVWFDHGLFPWFLFLNISGHSCSHAYNTCENFRCQSLGTTSNFTIYTYIRYTHLLLGQVRRQSSRFWQKNFRISTMKFVLGHAHWPDHPSGFSGYFLLLPSKGWQGSPECGVWDVVVGSANHAASKYMYDTLRKTQHIDRFEV